MEDKVLDIKSAKKQYEDILGSLSTKYRKIEYIASISALNLNKDIIGFFYQTIEKKYTDEEACLRLYGLLQAMFVSIDAIYSLSISLTNSKNFVNINDNPSLRELKYIRNDVVGHPTNRIVRKDVVYCILNPHEIEQYTFKYHVYNLDNEEIREVSYLRMIYDYYISSAKILDVLYNYQEVHKNKLFSDDLFYILNRYMAKETINNLFRQFKLEYRKVYSENSRIYKRIKLIDKINKLPRTELNRFSYLFHLNYLYTQVAELEKEEVQVVKLAPYPLEIKQIIKLFKSNPDLKPVINSLVDHYNPGFRENLNRMINITKKYNLTYARLFFEEIRKRISKNMFDEAYALEALLRLTYSE